MTSTIDFTKPEGIALREAWRRRLERLEIARQAAAEADAAFQSVLTELLTERGLKPPFPGNIEADEMGLPTRFIMRQPAPPPRPPPADAAFQGSRGTPAAKDERKTAPNKRSSHP